jgi:hypothetical protein
MPNQPGRLILPDDVRPLGDLERYRTGNGLRHSESLRFAPVDLADDYVFFNHGALFSYAGFVDDLDPIGDWFGTLPSQPLVIKQAYRDPLFEGLPALTIDNRVPWDRILCGVPRSYWDSLLEYISGICVVNRAEQSTQLVYYGMVDILDPSHVDEHGRLQIDLPTVQCYVFCLSGNKARHEFIRPYPLARRPKLVEMPPTQLMIDMGRKMTFSDIDPLVHRHNPAHRDFLLQYRAALANGPIIKEIP